MKSSFIKRDVSIFNNLKNRKRNTPKGFWIVHIDVIDHVRSSTYGSRLPE